MKPVKWSFSIFPLVNITGSGTTTRAGFAYVYDGLETLNITDGTDWFSLDDGTNIRNSRGISFPVTGTGLQDAIWDFNTTGGEYTGGTVYLPNGSITLTGAVRVEQNVRLVGISREQSILTASGSISSALLI